MVSDLADYWSRSVAVAHSNAARDQASADLTVSSYRSCCCGLTIDAMLLV